MDINEIFDRLDPDLQRIVLEMLQRVAAIQARSEESAKESEILKRRLVDLG